MTLETIQESIKIAMKTHATLEVEALRSVVAAVKKAAIDRQCEITEALVDEMLLKEVKIIKEQIDTCPDSRSEMKAEYKYKLMIVEAFAPKLIDDPVIIMAMMEAAVVKAGLFPETATKAQIMKIVMPTFKGKVDMKIANQLITQYTA